MNRMISALVFLCCIVGLSAQNGNKQEYKGDGGVVYYPTPAILAQPKKVKNYTIKGVVLLSDSTPVVGAVISPVKKKKPHAVSTDTDGKFTMNIKGKDPIILMVDFGGYNTVKFVASPEYIGQEVIISLGEIDEKQDVIVIGTSKQRGEITVKKPAIHLYWTGSNYILGDKIDAYNKKGK